MAADPANCRVCRGPDADPGLGRVQVWEDRYWRLTTSLGGEIAGFSYLEPKRHVPHITDLDGEEARTLGPVLAKVARALKEATDSQLVYIYVFGGGIPHLHLHLGPHKNGDALNPMMIRGEVVATKLPSGATSLVSKEFPQLPESRHSEVRERIRRALTESPTKE
jgi:diadenosine tetraphosphate (Ap4A) HIT family hydrolase